MFVQVIRGLVTGPGRVRAALDRWSGRLAAGAPGWLGTTAGVTGDGRFVALARFGSEVAARRSSDRPGQGRWWVETARLFTGEVVFRDSSDVTVDVAGDPGRAGFVQVMQGRGGDPGRARELMAQDPDERAAFRPDVIGGVTAGHEGGACTMAMYFTCEQAAREGGRKQPPPRLKAQVDEMSQLSIGEPDFLGLGQPWLYSP
jgi:hypothetical protein